MEPMQAFNGEPGHGWQGKEETKEMNASRNTHLAQLARQRLAAKLLLVAEFVVVRAMIGRALLCTHHDYTT